MKKFEKIGNGKNIVLLGYPIFMTEKLKRVVDRNDVTLLSFSNDYYSKFYDSLPQVMIGGGNIIPADNLDNAFRVAGYREIMDDIVGEVKYQRVTHVLLNSNMWHPFYLEKLKKEHGIVLATKIVDDPEGSKYYSEPVVKYYDKCICSGVYYDKNRTIEEMYYKWGAKKVKFLPVFIDPRHYDENIIEYNKKDIDVVHVGNFNWKRWILLSMLYRKFGEMIKLYSRHDPRESKGLSRIFFKILNLTFPLPLIDKIDDDELRVIYKRSKIGFNKHLSYGPSNARSYELCLNGVMQITDNPKGYQRIYRIGMEIKCYRNIKEAISLIDYYLKHKEDRESIARAGHKRAMADYAYEKVFDKHLKFILEK
jgi:hypothetical protein